MSYDKVNKVIICDAVGCNSTTNIFVHAGAWNGWTLFAGFDICPKCRLAAEQVTTQWFDEIELKKGI